MVAADALLVKQDDSAEVVSLRQLQTQAESNVRVRAAEADLAEKQVENEKMKEAGAKGAVSRWDVDRARLAVEIARLSLELAQFEHAQDALKLEESRLQIERMSLRSPIAGKVEKLFRPARRIVRRAAEGRARGQDRSALDRRSRAAPAGQGPWPQARAIRPGRLWRRSRRNERGARYSCGRRGGCCQRHHHRAHLGAQPRWPSRGGTCEGGIPNSRAEK